MVRAIVHKEGDRVLFEVSADEPEIAGLEDGQELKLAWQEPEPTPDLDPEIKAIAKRIIREHRDALDYLAQ